MSDKLRRVRYKRQEVRRYQRSQFVRELHQYGRNTQTKLAELFQTKKYHKEWFYMTKREGFMYMELGIEAYAFYQELVNAWLLVSSINEKTLSPV